MADRSSRFFRVNEVDGVPVVRFYDLDAAVANCEFDRILELQEELLSVAVSNPVGIILDFEARFFIPSATIEGMLIGLHKKLGAKLKLCHLPSMVMEHFELNRLSTLFQIYGTTEEALADVENS